MIKMNDPLLPQTYLAASLKCS